MLFKKILIAGLLITTVFSFLQKQDYNLAAKQGTLEFVVQICRHGARSPMWPTVDYDKWDIQRESLTSNGVRQHYLIGRTLRKELIYETDLLSEAFINSQIKAYATEAPRTIMSGQAQMMGLYDKSLPKITKKFDQSTDYPPIDRKGFRKILFFLKNRAIPKSMQPVPIYPRSDKVFNPDSFCPRIDRENDFFLNSPQYKDFQAKLTENGFYNRFQSVWPNEKNLNVQTVGRYYDTLNCDLYEGRKFPKGMNDSLFNEMIFIYDWEHLRRYYPNQMTTKLYATRFLNEIRAYFQNFKSNQADDPLQFVLYSTSDTQLKYVMMGLSLLTYTDDFETWSNKETHWMYSGPNFASTFFFQLYQKSTITGTQWFVSLEFNGKIIELPDCQSKSCSLDQFISILKQKAFTPEEWQSNCQ